MKLAWAKKIQTYSEAQMKRIQIKEEMDLFLKNYEQFDGPSLSKSFLK